MESLGLPANLIDDEIFGGRIMFGMTLLLQQVACTLPQALYAYADRYERLRRERPSEFRVGHEDYWSGFYS